MLLALDTGLTIREAALQALDAGLSIREAALQAVLQDAPRHLVQCRTQVYFVVQTLKPEAIALNPNVFLQRTSIVRVV